MSLLCAFFHRLALSLTLTLCVALLYFTNALSKCRVPPFSRKLEVAVNRTHPRYVRTYVRSVDR